MLYCALQIKDKQQLDELKDVLSKIGILDFENFQKDKPGLYTMSINPIITKTLDDFSDEEIKQEFIDRALDV